MKSMRTFTERYFVYPVSQRRGWRALSEEILSWSFRAVLCKMGNLYSRLTKSTSGMNSPCEGIKPEYSWDKYPKPNLKDYSLNNLNKQVVGKMPGCINGQQFLIHNCIDSVIYIFDHMNTVTIDDCSNCVFILGPVKQSLFIRDCENCICVAASGQFRARDCRSLDLFLCCPTQPTIESSFQLKFSCLQLYYHDFLDHMKMAHLSQFNNVWSCIHDFTPCDGKEANNSSHWSISSDESEPSISLEKHQDFSRVGLSFSREKSVIPHTISPSAKEINLAICQSVHLKISACLVVFVNKATYHSNVAMEFTHAIQMLHPNCSLTSSKEVYMKPEHPFARNTFGRSFDGGIVVGLRFFGPCCWEICQEVTEHITRNDPNEKQHIYLRRFALKELISEEDFFNTSLSHIPAFSG